MSGNDRGTCKGNMSRDDRGKGNMSRNDRGTCKGNMSRNDRGKGNMSRNDRGKVNMSRNDMFTLPRLLRRRANARNVS